MKSTFKSISSSALLKFSSSPFPAPECDFPFFPFFFVFVGSALNDLQMSSR